jgi:hypothetical protein
MVVAWVEAPTMHMSTHNLWPVVSPRSPYLSMSVFNETVYYMENLFINPHPVSSCIPISDSSLSSLISYGM